MSMFSWSQRVPGSNIGLRHVLEEEQCLVKPTPELGCIENGTKVFAVYGGIEVYGSHFIAIYGDETETLIKVYKNVKLSP
jgi:hypothetical protein